MSSTDPTEGHTAKAFDAALADLRLHVVTMGGLAIDQVSTAMRALLEGDSGLTDVVLTREERLNKFERDLLKDALAIVNKFRDLVRYHFNLKMFSKIYLE